MKQQGVTLIQMLFAVGLMTLLTQLGTSTYKKMSHDLQQQAIYREPRPGPESHAQ